MSIALEMSETDSHLLNNEYDSVRSGLVDLLNAARSASARSVNALMTATYWEIGRRIVASEMRGIAGLNRDCYETLCSDEAHRWG